jgi:hypothetical protein
MIRGRPLKSEIRQNVIEILSYLKKGYGYQICKIYNEVFPEVSQRSVYYHLRKGVDTGEILVQDVKIEDGEFSWGNKVEKTYYQLGPNAEPKGNKRIKKYLK